MKYFDMLLVKKITGMAFILALFSTCKEKYNAPVNIPAAGYLVVEGYINGAPGRSVIRLTRTTKLTDTVVKYERRAQLYIEGEGNGRYPLTETSPGTYTSDSFSLIAGQRYHLRIKTSNGKEYLSDYAVIRSTAPIDSISWQRESDGDVQTYIHSHDPQNNTRYYQWKTEETWEFRSEYLSNTKLVPATCPLPPLIPVYRFPATHAVDSSIYKCWQNENSSTLLLGSTESLASDVVYLPIVKIPSASWKIGVLYSLNIKQYALSKQAYRFLELMKRNTEQLGTVFDAQPSELKGNIHCITDPAEIVIGFVEITQEQTQRIFINNSQVPGWGYSSGCFPPYEIGSLRHLGCICYPIPPGPPDTCSDLTGKEAIPTFAKDVDPQGNIHTAYFAPPICVDCTLRGTNKKPTFWP